MTWQTNFLIASSKPSTLVTRSAYRNKLEFVKIITWIVSKDLVYLGVDLLPEHLELTHLQQISEVEQSFHLVHDQRSYKQI